MWHFCCGRRDQGQGEPGPEALGVLDPVGWEGREKNRQGR